MCSTVTSLAIRIISLQVRHGQYAGTFKGRVRLERRLMLLTRGGATNGIQKAQDQEGSVVLAQEASLAAAGDAGDGSNRSAIPAAMDGELNSAAADEHDLVVDCVSSAALVRDTALGALTRAEISKVG
jgi:hypothetical protein